MSSPSSSQRDTESRSPCDSQENNDRPIGLKTKPTKKYSRYAFDLRDTENLSPYRKIEFSK